MALEKVNRGLQRLLKGRTITILMLIAFGLVATAGRAACTGSAWNLGASGDWNVAGNWNPSGVPNSSSTNVCIVDGSSTVNLTNLSPTVGDLTLASGNGLDISTGLVLTVDGGSISNSGEITLNGGGGANGYIVVGNNTTLSGSGTLTLATTSSGGGGAFIEQPFGNFTLTNSDNTIQGNGVIGNGGLALVNQSGGVIDATTASGQIATLTLNGGGAITNQGLMEATTGTLVINTTVNNAGGNITANGGTVQIENRAIQGGTLNTTARGTMETAPSTTVTLDGTTRGALTISAGSAYTASDNSNTILLGAITNKGNIQLNGGGGANGFINIDKSVTLSGGGKLTLATTTAGGGGSAIIQQDAGGLTLTNADNTIQGNGTIGNNGLALVNQSGGVIDATTASGQIGSLTLNGGGAITSQGLLEATSGTLVIQNVVTNAGGNITANVGTVDVNTTITGGTLNTTGGGTMQTFNGAATLDGVTISSGSTYTASNNATTDLQGAITNNGTIDLNGGSGANGLLNIDNNVTLTGGGVLTLSTAGVSGNAIIQQNVTGITLTNANNTIQGNGTIGNNGLAVANAATISANVSGAALVLNGGGTVTNTGQLNATGGGILQIENPVANAGGTIIAGGGSTVQLLNGSSVTGGTLIASGTLETATGNLTTLDGSTVSGAVTINGTYTASDNATTILLGTITNIGAIQLNGGNGANGLLNLGSGAAPNLTLQGGGTLALATTALNGGNAIIQQDVSGVTLTNVDNTIAGNGIIGNNGLAVVNETGGTIDATTASGQIGSLTLNGGGAITNQGLLEATSGTLVIQNVVTNTGGNITANGGTVDVNTTITGGTLNTTGGGTMQTFNGSATLNGVTISSGSTYTASNNATTHLQGTITNNGTIDLNGGSGANGLLNIDSNVTLTGGGTLALATTALNGGNAIIQQDVSGVTLTNVDNTIAGNGIIGNNGLAVVNETGGTIDATTASGQIGSLTLNGGGAITNQGVLEATSGTLVIENAVANTGGNITADGGTVDVNTTIAGGTLNTTGGGTMQTFNGSATLTGVTISSGSTYTASNNSTTHLQGTITNNGAIDLNGGAGANGLLNIDNNVTLTGGGTLTLSTTNSSAGGNAIIQQNASGITLTNVNNTIQGNGIIGSNGLALVNDGLLLANVTGQTLLVNGSGALTNNGAFEATAGSTLHTQNGAFTNFRGSTLTGGTYVAVGTIQIDQLGANGGEIVTNNANIFLDGLNGGAALISDAAGKNALSSLATNQGSLTLENGGNANFTTVGTLANSGLVTVGGGTTLKLGSGGASSFTQSADVTQGDGTIAGAVTINGGAVQPGTHNAPGTLTINGSYNQVGGTFAEQIASMSNFGVLNVTGGGLTLGSSSLLNISLLNGFDPVGDTFTIMNATGGVSGAFSNAPASGFAMDGVNWTVAYNSNDIVLNGVSLVGSLVTATWNTASGTWTTATEWACSPGPSTCVPNNSGSNTYAVVVSSAGNTLTLNTSETVNTLSLQAGTLDITATGSLSLAAQPNGITDIGAGAGLSLEGSLTDADGNALANLATIEGSLTLDNGQTTTLAGGLTNSGTLTVSGTGADLAVTGTLSNSSHVSIGNGATLTAAGFTNNTGGLFGFTTGSTVQSTGNVSNAGTLTVSGTGTKLAVAGTLSNSFQVSVGNGATLTAGGFTNNTGGLFGFDTGSTARSTGDFSNAGTVSICNGATLSAATYTQGAGTTDVNGTMLLPAVQINGGTVNLNTGGTIQGTTYTQAAGTTDVNGTLISPTVSISSGMLTGDGSVRGNVTQTGGTLQPGDPPGTLSIIGNLNLSNTTYNDQIAGGTPGTGYSVLDVSGALGFGASDTLIPLDELSFNPSNGETFDIINAGSITGTFDNNDIAFDGGTFTVSYDTAGCASGSDCVVLTWNKPTGVTPEPASLLLFGTGLLGLAWLVRRRRRVASRG